MTRTISSTRSNRLAWSLGGLVEYVLPHIVGIAIFLVTNEPDAGIVLPLIFAARPAFRTGLWILRSDPCRARARICFAFCMATACWQAAASAFASLLLFVIVAVLTGKQPDMQRFAVTMIMLVGGVVLTAVAGLCATVVALMAVVPVWVNPRLKEIVRENLNSVADVPRGMYFNHAVFVIATSIAFPILAVSCSLLIFAQSPIVTAVSLIAGPALACVLYGGVSDLVVAQHPSDCWEQPD